MPKLGNHLTLPRCPHCSVDSPSLPNVAQFKTQDSEGAIPQAWRCYACSRCGGVVIGWHHANDGTLEAKQLFPEQDHVDDAIPGRASEFLNQAMNSLSAPAGAVMLAASAVDAMLKEKGLSNGTLNDRIDEAAKSHLITAEMARWAHQIRLDANSPRHADEKNPLPEPDDAKRCIDFATALGTFLFVLPAQVTRGLEQAEDGDGEA